MPQQKDKNITSLLRESFAQSKATTSMDFPYVSETPIDEYDLTTKLFCKAFPWLFPGGVGEPGDSECKENIDAWAERLLYYYDGRFAKDKMWCFFALNYSLRRKNAENGSYFVSDFNGKGPQSLEELQDLIKKNSTDWVDKIQYYSRRIKGSAGYWRFKRSEVYSWINYHVAQKNGPPSLFMTFSCAEYYWEDIKRLLKQRLEVVGRANSVNDRNYVQMINDYTIVVQEYFQKRLSFWLQTVGKQVFRIKHYWLRYEFAPGRGQIHAHMLAITDHKQIFKKFNDMKQDEQAQAKYLSEWMATSLYMTASVHNELLQKIETIQEHPASHRFGDNNNLPLGETHLLYKLQYHKCTGKCMKKRKYTEVQIICSFHLLHLVWPR